MHFTHFYDEPHEVLRVFFVNLTDRDRSPVAVAALDEQRRNRNLARGAITRWLRNGTGLTGARQRLDCGRLSAALASRWP